MTKEDTAEYHAKCEKQEPKRADAATDVAVRATHLDVAERYAKLKDEAAPAGRVIAVRLRVLY